MNGYFRKGDFWAGLALAALGAYIISQARGWEYMAEDGPGAGFFPLWYGAVMVVLSLLLVGGTVLKHDPASKTEAINWNDVGRAMTVWLALVICVAILKYVGFLIAFGLLTWFIVAVMFRRAQTTALSLAVGMSLGFYAVFTWGLELQLPMGTLF
ncbi:MAG: tripartite tricarboxylate transporter TctB family protein [Pseudomonadota bacterium]